MTRRRRFVHNEGTPIVYLGGSVLPPEVAFTRSTIATAFVNGVLTTFPINTPRFGTTVINSTNPGFVVENAFNITNRLLYCRDFTQTNWTKSNVTTAKTVTGIDGAANSASLLTASSTNGTALQSITVSSGLFTTSFFVRRRTGTGTIEITDNNGTNYTNITSLINSTTWTRVQISRTQANPVVGFRIGTSGDAIEVDCGQVENLDYASTPILTTSATVTRGQDIATIDPVDAYPWFDYLVGSVVTTFTPSGHSASGASTLFSISDGSQNYRVYNRINTSGTRTLNMIVTDNSSSQMAASTSNATTANVQSKAAIAYEDNNCALVLDNGTVVTDVVVSIPLYVLSIMTIGRNPVGAEPFMGIIHGMTYFNRRLSNTELKNKTI